jgi:hypothetical protein
LPILLGLASTSLAPLTVLLALVSEEFHRQGYK